MEPAERSHPAEEELGRFMRGELKRPEVQPIVRHLLTGCPRCVAVTRRFWDLGERPLHDLGAMLDAESDQDRSERGQRKLRAV